VSISVGRHPSRFGQERSSKWLASASATDGLQPLAVADRRGTFGQKQPYGEVTDSGRSVHLAF
jgi:hypothetical protein